VTKGGTIVIKIQNIQN